jgi:PAS domain S-box-containing protein
VRDRPQNYIWLIAFLAGSGSLLVAMALYSLIGLLRSGHEPTARSLPAIFRANLRRAIILLGITLVAGTATHTYISNQQHLHTLQQQMVSEKKDLLTLMVNQAFDQIGYGRAELEQQGLSEADIQNQIKKRLSAISFDDGDGYIFVNSHDGIVLVNRTRSEIIGRNVYNLTDRNRIHTTQSINNAAQHSEGGFVSYLRNKHGLDSKLSYSRSMPDWGWVVGARVYTDDMDQALLTVQKESAHHLMTDLAILFCLTLIVLLLLDITSRRLMATINTELTSLQDAISNHDVCSASYHFSEFQTISDLTAQSFQDLEQARQTADESESQLRDILNALDAGVVIIQPEEHKILYVNPSAARTIGCEAARLVGTVCHRHICPAEQGQCPITDLGKAIDNSRRTLITASGKIIPILKTVRPFTYCSQPALLETFVDISEQVESEEKL